MFGHDMDPAKLRGSPLGWYFTLFFLIQGFMPVGFAIGIASTRTSLLSSIAIVAAGGLLSAVAVTMLVRAALRARKRVQHFEEARGGRRAQAQVLGVEYIGQAGTVKSGGSRRSYVKLRVHVARLVRGSHPLRAVGRGLLHDDGEGPARDESDRIDQPPSVGAGPVPRSPRLDRATAVDARAADEDARRGAARRRTHPAHRRSQSAVVIVTARRRVARRATCPWRWCRARCRTSSCTARPCRCSCICPPS